MMSQLIAEVFGTDKMREMQQVSLELAEKFEVSPLTSQEWDARAKALRAAEGPFTEAQKLEASLLATTEIAAASAFAGGFLKAMKVTEASPTETGIQIPVGVPQS